MHSEQLDDSQKSVVAFVDGQNLFHAAKAAFGHSFPNYDPAVLAQQICRQQGWRLKQTRFYTGVPSQADNPFWHGFWNNKLAALAAQRGVNVYKRELQYRDETIRLPDGGVFRYRSGHEKGIDVRMAIDLVAMAYRGGYDVALIFSQDQDLVEAAQEIRSIARETGRWIKVASAYPHKTPGRGIGKGIDRTDWIPFGKELYDNCLDRADYRPEREDVERILSERARPENALDDHGRAESDPSARRPGDRQGGQSGDRQGERASAHAGEKASGQPANHVANSFAGEPKGLKKPGTPANGRGQPGAVPHEEPIDPETAGNRVWQHESETIFGLVDDPDEDLDEVNGNR